MKKTVVTTVQDLINILKILPPDTVILTSHKSPHGEVAYELGKSFNIHPKDFYKKTFYELNPFNCTYRGKTYIFPLQSNEKIEKTFKAIVL